MGGLANIIWMQKQQYPQVSPTGSWKKIDLVATLMGNHRNNARLQKTSWRTAGQKNARLTNQLAEQSTKAISRRRVHPRRPRSK